MTPPVRLFIDGVKVADGSPGDDPAAPYAVDGLTVNWGRPTSVDQPEPSTCSFSIVSRTDVPDPDLFAQTIRLGRRVDVDAGEDQIVFVGYITDVSMTPASDDPAGKMLVAVTADCLLADLANRPAATVARPKESANSRFGAVLDAARLATTYVVDPDIAGIMCRRIEADRGSTTAAAELLQNIATSVDGVLWSTVALVDSGPGTPTLLQPSLWLESPQRRAPLRRLEYVAPYVRIVNVAAAAGALPIDPCVPDLEPIEWRQTMSDLTTGITITYYIPDPTDSTVDVGVVVSIVEPGAESITKPWGVRRMTVDSELTSSADANILAGKILSRISEPTWRLNSVNVDGGSVSDADLVKLIAMKTRHGLPITISPLPPWAPPDSDTFAGYLEGGEITSMGGVWSTSLWLSLAQGGGLSGRWIDLPNPRITSTWTYSVDPLDGTYRWASGAKVLTIAFIDSTGADRTAELSAAVAGDVALIEWGAGDSWHATITVNAVTNKVQYTVTNIVGTMPAVGTLTQITICRAGEALGPWRWKDIDPAISWADLVGVSGPIGT